MNVTGIIAEYNPFHHGHKYQIDRIKQKNPDAYIIAIMSGSITQRGSLTIFDKWTRARLAILGGADLVIELPTVFAVQSAQNFARGAINIFNKLNIIGELAFGAEEKNIDNLQKSALSIDSYSTQAKLHEKIAQGYSYAAALTAAAAISSAEKNILTQPNNILAIEYLRALNDSSSNISPYLIPREGAGYHETDLKAINASATAVRKITESILFSQPDNNLTLAKLLDSQNKELLSAALPSDTFNTLMQLTADTIPNIEKLFLPLRAIFLRSSTVELTKIYGINEGLENRLIKYTAAASGYKDLIKLATTKRYSTSRLARTLIYILLNISADDIAALNSANALYARVLAVGNRGRQLLPILKKNSAIPLITKVSTYLNSKKRGEENLTPLEKMLRYDTLAAELRQLCTGDTNGKNDFQMSPLFL